MGEKERELGSEEEKKHPPSGEESEDKPSKGNFLVTHRSAQAGTRSRLLLEWSPEGLASHPHQNCSLLIPTVGASIRASQSSLSLSTEGLRATPACFKGKGNQTVLWASQASLKTDWKKKKKVHSLKMTQVPRGQKYLVSP